MVLTRRAMILITHNAVPTRTVSTVSSLVDLGRKISERSWSTVFIPAYQYCLGFFGSTVQIGRTYYGKMEL